MSKRTKLKTEWDLSLILPKADKKTVEKGKKAMRVATDRLVKKWGNRTDYLKKPQVLKEALDDYEKWFRLYSGGGAAGFYFGLKSEIEQGNPFIKAEVDKIREFSAKQWNKLRFFSLNLSHIPEKQRQVFLRSSILKPYRAYLETIFKWAPYRLTEQEESLLLLLSGPAYNSWVRMQEDFLSHSVRPVDIDGKKQTMTLPKLFSSLESTNKKTRDEAAKAINSILSENVSTAEAELNAVLRTKAIEDEARGFSRPDKSRHLDDDIETGTVEAMIAAVSARNGLSKKYYKLKAKLLGVTKLAYHERPAPIGKSTLRYSYPEGVVLLRDVFSSLHPKFSSIFEDFTENGHIDVYPKVGKRGGAFCSDHRLGDPIYVMVNWNNKMYDVNTLAHEMGHAIHFEFAKKKQNAYYKGASTATAEVASTFMEDFALQKMMSKMNDNTRLAVLIEKMDGEISTIFRQVAAYKFEQELHETFRREGYLSKESIGRLFQKHMAQYMGPAVEQSPGSENWWVHWIHFRYFFYVYSYASGVLISKALQKRVRQDSSAIKDVIAFFSAGTSDTPENIFKSIGIDITKKSFWEEGLKEVEELYDEIYLLAKKLKKI